MLYGIILESARDGVIVFHGDNVWKRIVQELQLPSETFQLFARYDHKIIFDICECKYVYRLFHSVRVDSDRYATYFTRWNT
jgi:hypothetical protein